MHGLVSAPLDFGMGAVVLAGGAFLVSFCRWLFAAPSSAGPLLLTQEMPGLSDDHYDLRENAVAAHCC